MIEIQEIEEAPEVQADIEIAEIEEAAEKRTVESILIDLQDWTSEFTGEQLKGFLAAIEVIKANY